MVNLKNKKGFTLVELIVSAAITTIVIGAVSIMMILGFKTFNAGTQTAQQQRNIRMVESVLKDNLQIAESYSFSTTQTGDTQIYFNSEQLVLKSGSTTLMVNGITKITVNMQLSSAGCYANYEIKTKGITQTGSVALNNITSTNISTSSYVLMPADLHVFNIIKTV